MSKIIDGKVLAKKHEQALREKIKKLTKRAVLVSFLVGNDPPSVLYTNIKKKKASDLGIDFRDRKFSKDTSNKVVADEIKKSNLDPEVDGVMIQLPSFPHLIDLIDPKKDVDGLTNQGRFLPAVVRAILSILEDENINLKGKKIVVVGSEGMVGSQLMKAFEQKGLNLSGVDKNVKNFSDFTKDADILISTTGVPKIIKGDMIKDGAVIIDVGIEKVNGKLLGDIDFESVAPKASKLTPVPGGVGPMTVISLMENVVESVEEKEK